MIPAVLGNRDRVMRGQWKDWKGDEWAAYGW